MDALGRIRNKLGATTRRGAATRAARSSPSNHVHRDFRPRRVFRLPLLGVCFLVLPRSECLVPDILYQK